MTKSDSHGDGLGSPTGADIQGRAVSWHLSLYLVGSVLTAGSQCGAGP